MKIIYVNFALILESVRKKLMDIIANLTALLYSTIWKQPLLKWLWKLRDISLYFTVKIFLLIFYFLFFINFYFN